MKIGHESGVKLELTLEQLAKAPVLEQEVYTNLLHHGERTYEAFKRFNCDVTAAILEGYLVECAKIVDFLPEIPHIYDKDANGQKQDTPEEIFKRVVFARVFVWCMDGRYEQTDTSVHLDVNAGASNSDVVVRQMLHDYLDYQISNIGNLTGHGITDKMELLVNHRNKVLRSMTDHGTACQEISFVVVNAVTVIVDAAIWALVEKGTFSNFFNLTFPEIADTESLDTTNKSGITH